MLAPRPFVFVCSTRWAVPDGATVLWPLPPGTAGEARRFGDGAEMVR